MQARVAKRLEELAMDPYAKSLKLQGHEGMWRARVGALRIIYLVEEVSGRIVIERVHYRGAVYRRL